MLVSIVGNKDTGKSRLLTKLFATYQAKGCSVSFTDKRSHHLFLDTDSTDYVAYDDFMCYITRKSMDEKIDIFACFNYNTSRPVPVDIMYLSDYVLTAHGNWRISPYTQFFFEKERRPTNSLSGVCSLKDVVDTFSDLLNAKDPIANIKQSWGIS